MTNKIFLIVMSIMMLVFFTFAFMLTSDPSTNKKMSHDRVRYLKDSLEMEYIKKQLESYPYDHSEIKDTIYKND